MAISAIVLAAGKGTRMRSDLPKMLHRARGRSLLRWVLAALDPDRFDPTVIVVGHGKDQVIHAVTSEIAGREFHFVEQLSQRGTGDAAAVGLGAIDSLLPGYDDDDHVVVLPGDTPLLHGTTVDALVETHLDGGAAATLVTARIDNPTGYGRIIRTPADQVSAIVEERDASPEQRHIDEINAGMYCFRRSMLAPALRMIDADNAQGELYLTDVIGVLSEAGHKVLPFPADPMEIAGVNDRAQLGAAAQVLAHRIARHWMASGVTIENPASTVIDAGVMIEADVTILSGTTISGSTTIGTGAVVGPDAHLVDATIGDGAKIQSSTVRNASVGPGETLGPYAVREQE